VTWQGDEAMTRLEGGPQSPWPTEGEGCLIRPLNTFTDFAAASGQLFVEGTMKTLAIILLVLAAVPLFIGIVGIAIHLHTRPQWEATRQRIEEEASRKQDPKAKGELSNEFDRLMEVLRQLEKLDFEVQHESRTMQLWVHAILVFIGVLMVSCSCFLFFRMKRTAFVTSLVLALVPGLIGMWGIVDYFMTLPRWVALGKEMRGGRFYEEMDKARYIGLGIALGLLLGGGLIGSVACVLFFKRALPPGQNICGICGTQLTRSERTKGLCGTCLKKC
jgi:hypothetical protein